MGTYKLQLKPRLAVIPLCAELLIKENVVDCETHIGVNMVWWHY